MSKVRIFCTNPKCDMEVLPDGDKMETTCKCGNIHVLWDVFANPVTPVTVRGIDSRYTKVETQ